MIVQETRRKQAAEAAEKRLANQEARGVKDPEKLKRDKERREAIEREAEKRDREAKHSDDIALQVTNLFRFRLVPLSLRSTLRYPL